MGKVLSGREELFLQAFYVPFYRKIAEIGTSMTLCCGDSITVALFTTKATCNFLAIKSRGQLSQRHRVTNKIN